MSREKETCLNSTRLALSKDDLIYLTPHLSETESTDVRLEPSLVT